MRMWIFIGLKVLEIVALPFCYLVGRVTFRFIDGCWNPPPTRLQKLACYCLSTVVGVIVVAVVVAIAVFIPWLVRLNWQWAAQIMEAMG